MYDSCVETLRAGGLSAEQNRLRAAGLAISPVTGRLVARRSGAHLTASSLICQPETGFVLLTLHARIGRWLQTGGHIEATDSGLLAAALREATEESGLPELTVDPTPLLLSRHEVECGTVRPTTSMTCSSW